MILDTNAVSDLFEGNSRLEARLRVAPRHHLPTVVIGEYRFGLRRSAKQPALERLLTKLEEDSIVLYPDRTTAVRYAEVRHRLRTAGTSLPENDVWIAALAVQHDLAVVTRDRHYDLVEGVTRLDW